MSEAGDDTVVHVDEANASNEGLEAIADMKVLELKKALKQRKLKTSGNKKELRNRLRAAMTLEIEHGEDNDDEEVTDESDDDSDNSEDEMRDVRGRMCSLTFRDVEESMTTFSGDDRINVNGWLREFEEMAGMCKWTDMQKIVYAKRLLRGSAKLFINYEQCCKSWSKLRKALKREFSEIVDAHKIHKELARRIKRTDETYQQYIYQMFEIAKQIEIDTSSVIKYIIAGVQDDEINKTVLYGARSIRELKEKFALYETMKENMRPRSRHYEEKPKRTNRGDLAEEVVRRCFLCGGKDHLSSSCPTKNRGMKCFECREFGHIASDCPKKLSSEVNEVCSVSKTSRRKNYKDVTIEGHQAAALIDTGSDLSLMRRDKYIKIGAPQLQRKEIRFRGGGSINNRTLGQFHTNIIVDQNSYPIVVHVVSDNVIKHEMVIGVDFLDTVDLNIRKGNVSITKSEARVVEKNSCSGILPRNYEYEVNTVDLLDDVEADHSAEVENIVCNNSVSMREVDVQKSVVLKGDEAITQCATQMSLSEREVVNVQVGERRREGIVKPSVLGCTSALAKRVAIDVVQNACEVVNDHIKVVVGVVHNVDDDTKVAIDVQNACDVNDDKKIAIDDVQNDDVKIAIDVVHNDCEIVDDRKVAISDVRNDCDVNHDVKMANNKSTIKRVKEYCDVIVLDVNSWKERVREVNETSKLITDEDEEDSGGTN